MVEPLGDQGKVPEKNPYEVSTVASADLTQQPTALQIIGAVILAIGTGAIAFFPTCFGTGILLAQFGLTIPGVIFLAILVGALVAGITIYKSYGTLIGSWTTHRKGAQSSLITKPEWSREDATPGSDTGDPVQ